jgi:hypothetical protein
MEFKSKLVELLRRTSAEEQALDAKLSAEEKSSLGEENRWSAKDMVFHMAGWKERLAANLAAVAAGEAPVRNDDFQTINADDFKMNRERSWAEALRQAEAASEQLIAQVEARSEDELRSTDALPWLAGRPVWQLIAGNGCVHPLAMHLGPFSIQRGDKAYAGRLQAEFAGLLDALDDGGVWRGTVRYNLACHHALAGEAEKAIDALREAFRLNPDLIAWSKEDTDLAPIRNEAGFRQLYAASE